MIPHGVKSCKIGRIMLYNIKLTRKEIAYTTSEEKKSVHA